ncbi:hypothetical protein [Tropicimonas marinistellae]|uniref:hypothetical protein n=1 Tax=Tropicimonas marinistellae TaxID=1739787 RepID=UPI00082E2CC7|nr:hypothetical protein [Tropicimonas marinistellae]
MTTATCPVCDSAVSPKAFDCPNCGHPLRKLRRGFFGILFKWLFIGWNLLMLAWLVLGLGDVGSQMDGLSEAEQAGAAIGATIGIGMVITVWALGDIVLGLLVLFTRPRK